MQTSFLTDFLHSQGGKREKSFLLTQFEGLSNSQCLKKESQTGSGLEFLCIYVPNPTKRKKNESELQWRIASISQLSIIQFIFLKKKEEERKKNLQANDKALSRASNHGPATWVNRVPIPILKHTMGILKGSFYAH